MRAAAIAALLLTGALGVLALAPIHAPSHDQLFEIPKGTWARRMAGNKVEILPAELRLTIGVRDILVLHNLDDVPQQFGPILLMPGQTFRMPFSMPAGSAWNGARLVHQESQASVGSMAVFERPASSGRPGPGDLAGNGGRNRFALQSCRQRSCSWTSSRP